MDNDGFVIKVNELGLLDSVHRKEQEEEIEVARKRRFQLNAPSSDLRCDCCDKHVSELKPFGKAGDPLVGDFDGALLVKKYRPSGPYNEEADKILGELFRSDISMEEYDDALVELAKVHGEEKINRLSLAMQAYDAIGKSWECRDCIVMDTDQYIEMYRKNYRREN